MQQFLAGLVYFVGFASEEEKFSVLHFDLDYSPAEGLKIMLSHGLASIGKRIVWGLAKLFREIVDKFP